MIILLVCLSMLILLIPIKVRSKSFISISGKSLCENVSLGLIPTFAFNLKIDEEKGITLNTPPASGKIDKKSGAKKFAQKILNRIDVINLPLSILKHIKLKSIKIIGELSLEDAMQTAMALGIIRCLYVIIVAKNRALAEKSSFFLQSYENKFNCDVDFTIELKFTPLIIIGILIMVLIKSMYKERRKI